MEMNSDYLLSHSALAEYKGRLHPHQASTADMGIAFVLRLCLK